MVANQVSRWQSLPHNRCPEYRVWQMMVQRCHNPNNKRYRLYGGRGIQVCERWRSSFDLFMGDVEQAIGPRPTNKHSLDRIDNDGNYEPGNVRWATQREQVLNSRNPLLVTVFAETLPSTVWDERMAFRAGTVAGRVRRGWPSVLAVLVPLGDIKVRYHIRKGRSVSWILKHTRPSRRGACEAAPGTLSAASRLGLDSLAHPSGGGCAGGARKGGMK